ncbi:hypothetical protein, partial [Priestia megaterium]|uniref:hypothetical protein n=1 Tax=Priestia megaterium TaxID=1404 RepID=UPI0035B6423C
MKTWPDTAEALLNDLAFPQLRVRHRTAVKSFVENMRNLTSIKDVSLLMDVMDVRSYLREAKRVSEPG